MRDSKGGEERASTQRSGVPERSGALNSPTLCISFGERWQGFKPCQRWGIAMQRGTPKLS